MKTPRPRFDARKVIADMALKGWNPEDLARGTSLSVMTIRRFLRGEVQTARTNARIAQALGFRPHRYFTGVDDVEVA